MSWKHIDQVDFLGATPFQNLCCREIRKFLPDLDFAELGEEEKTFVGTVPRTEIELSLFADSVSMVSPEHDLHLRASHFHAPENLVSKLIRELSNAI